MRGPIKYQVSQVWSKLDGIGKSKAEHRKESPVKNVDNTRITSPLVHSFEYKDEIFKTAKNLFNYAHERGVKDMTKLDAFMVENWFENKIDKEVSRDVLRNYLSHIVKIQIALETIASEEGNEYIGFTKEDLSDIHMTVKNMEKNKYINRAYKQPGYIVGMLLDVKHNLAGNLQWKYGLRVTEATHIKSSQLDGTVLTVTGKGGYKQIKILSEEHAEDLRSLMVEGLFSVSQKAYRRALEESSITMNEKYRGTHGLRYNFSQNLFNVQFNHEHYVNKVPPLEAEKLALLYVSKELGHHRKEITNHYLGG